MAFPMFHSELSTIGNVGFVHETLVVAQDVERTVVHLNLRNH